MSRTPAKPVPRYTLKDAVAAAAAIRRLRAEAGDPDLDARFPVEVLDDDDVDAVIAYIHTHRRVSPVVRAAELEHWSRLLEYEGQRNADRHERRVLAMLETGRQLGVQPKIYGEPMGLVTRQAVYHRRATLAARRPAVVLGDEGRAQEWLNEHAAELRALADVLIDNRDELLLLVDEGVARSELTQLIDHAGALMNSRRPSQEFCTAVAYALFGLRPAVARPAMDPVVRAQLEEGLRLLW